MSRESKRIGGKIKMTAIKEDSFSISFLPQKKSLFSIWKRLCFGEIKIGRFHESFEASLTYWNKEQYRNHWQREVQRVVDGGEKSALITTMYHPKRANFIFWWPMYRFDDRVIFQNHILFLDQIEGVFDPENPQLYLGDYVGNTEGEHQISEWDSSIKDLKDFLNK